MTDDGGEAVILKAGTGMGPGTRKRFILPIPALIPADRRSVAGHLAMGFFKPQLCVILHRTPAVGSGRPTKWNVMKNAIWMLILLAGLLQACHTPEILVHPELSADPMPVKGRQGFRIRQVIRFGDYTTDRVRRGWVAGYDVPFTLRFRGAREKLRFTQFGPGEAKAYVVCASRFREVEFRPVSEFFGIPLSYQNYFAGDISLGPDQPSWEFVIHNPDGDFLRSEASAGFARTLGRRIDIVAIRGFKGQPAWLSELAVTGFEFRIEGEVFGAVSTVNRGTVWIDPTVNEELGVVMASLATGLLLRSDVEGVDMNP